MDDETWRARVHLAAAHRLAVHDDLEEGIDNDGYTGLADSMSEGERLASVLGPKQIMFMKNHGVLVVGDTVAQAYRRLYKLERAAHLQAGRAPEAGIEDDDVFHFDAVAARRLDVREAA